MSAPLDLTKPVQTKSGRPARVICTDAKGLQRIVALVRLGDGSESVETYGRSGAFRFSGKESSWDLVNVPDNRVPA